MIFYLTFNDSPSGIYSSQVIDVVNFLNKNLKTNVRLIAFISIRDFLINRSKIKNEISNAIVLPSFPGVHRWKNNIFLFSLFCLVYKPKAIIARSVLATQIAMKSTKNLKIVYDGRGAITAEWKEYNVITNSEMLSEIYDYEKEVVLKSDFRIAVSNALVDYWGTEFNYKSNNHVVIPCTLNSIFEKNNFTEVSIINARNELNLKNDDIVFIYSGSIAGWQSFDLLKEFMISLLEKNDSNKLVFLSKLDNHIKELIQLFPHQVICKHLEPEKVPYYLLAGDYGLLIREKSITNKVASPLKYAEYLSCGLQVVISDELGDYSKLSLKEKWGSIYTDENKEYGKICYDQKKDIQHGALSFFTKKMYLSQYQKLFDYIN